ncbi:unnamed protein product [Rhodiola kirilowii]
MNLSSPLLWQIMNILLRRQMKVSKHEIVDELGGQYEYTFNHVKLESTDLFPREADPHGWPC